MDPATASTAIGTANALAKNSVVRDLLGPIAKAYGTDWGERAQERIEKAKAERRAKNLDEHLANAQREVPIERIDPAVLERWAVGVSEIDPLDHQLSAAWRAALRAAASRNPYREKILRLLETMTPDEVYHFLRPQHFYILPAEYRRRFVELGLCQPPRERFLHGLMLVMPAGFVLAALVFLFMPEGLDMGQLVEGGDRTRTFFIAWSLALGWGAGATTCMIWLSLVPTLTRLGHALRRLSRSSLSAVVTVSPPAPQPLGASAERPGRAATSVGTPSA